MQRLTESLAMSSHTILTRAAKSPMGDLHIYATELGVVHIALPNADLAKAEERLATTLSASIEEGFHELEDPVNELAEYFAGSRQVFGFDLDRRLSTGFAGAVHAQMENIPYGETVSYKDLAAATGKPLASRAVGRACGANPLPIVVPCHRVLTTAGTIGGYGGGLEMKHYLLSLEGVAVKH